MSEQDYIQLTLFPGDSHASPLVWLESKKEKGTTVIYGRKCSELSENLRRVGLSVRTYLESCPLPGKQFVRTWSVRDTLSPYLILKLRLSEQGIEERGSSLWATPNTMDTLPSRSYEAMKRQATNGGRKNRKRPGNLREQVDPLMCQAYKDASAEANGMMWPTPTGTERSGINPNTGKGAGLSKAVQMRPTPIADDAKNVNPKPNRIAGLCSAVKDCEGTGSLNPTWVEWLQGFPVGWTDIGE